jgi:hypothetical protein
VKKQSYNVPILNFWVNIDNNQHWKKTVKVQSLLFCIYLMGISCIIFQDFKKNVVFSLFSFVAKI